MAKPVNWDAPRPNDVTAQKTTTGVRAEVPLSEAGKVLGRIKISMTNDRVLRVDWEAIPGSEPLAGFEAWSNV